MCPINWYSGRILGVKFKGASPKGKAPTFTSASQPAKQANLTKTP